MAKPILTRKSYREALEKERHQQERSTRHSHEEDVAMAPSLEEMEDDFSTPVMTRRPRLTLLQRYNRLLNVWLIGLVIAIIVIILVQIFL